MKPCITESEAKHYLALSSRAAQICDLIEQLTLEIVQADIPDENKVGALNWLARAGGLRGLPHALHPQSEWQGGETWKIRQPDLSRIK